MRASAVRRGAALLGVFAILLQAALFAGHRHPFPLAPRGAPTVLEAVPTTGTTAPGLADDDCQICFALARHSAAPVDFFAAPPGSVSLPIAPIEAILAFAARFLHFRSRAPPRA